MLEILKYKKILCRAENFQCIFYKISNSISTKNKWISLFSECYKLRKEWTLTRFIIFVHKGWGNWNFPSDIKFSLPSGKFLGGIWKVDEQLSWKLQNIDYIWRNLVGEMESSKIIDEVNLFRNRPYYCTAYFNLTHYIFGHLLNFKHINVSYCDIPHRLQAKYVKLFLVMNIVTLGTKQPKII